MSDSEPAHLETAGAVIDALGGTGACARAVGSSIAAVSNWRGKGRFPPQKFLIFSKALAAINVTAPNSLWQQDERPPANLVNEKA